MRSGNNIHVQQHKTNMINEEWNKTQINASFVALYDMRAVTFVLPDEMADVSIAGLQWFISYTGRRPASLCHGPLSVVRPCVRSSVRPCVNFFFKHLLL